MVDNDRTKKIGNVKQDVTNHTFSSLLFSRKNSTALGKAKCNSETKLSKAYPHMDRESNLTKISTLASNKRSVYKHCNQQSISQSPSRRQSPQFASRNKASNDLERHKRSNLNLVKGHALEIQSHTDFG